MKRMIALLSAALLALSVTACGNDQKNDSNNANDAVLNGTDGKDNTHGDGIMGDVAQGTEDVVQGTEDAVKDAENGVKDAVDGVEKGVDDMTDTAENAGREAVRGGGRCFLWGNAGQRPGPRYGRRPDRPRKRRDSRLGRLNMLQKKTGRELAPVLFFRLHL